MDIVNQLRRLSTENPSPRDCIDEAADEIERLRAEVRHWKANHDNRVDAARLLIERHDLPIDRLPAYKHYLRLQEDVAHYRAEVDELKQVLDEQNVPRKYVQRGGIIYCLYGSSSIAAYEALEAEKKERN